MSLVDSPAKRKLLIRLVVLLVVALVAGVLLLRGIHLSQWVERGMAVIRDAGPLVFFLAMALLPAVGVPLMFFTLVAGEAFAAQLTLGGVLAITLVVVAFNLALTYWLARRAVHPLLERLLQRFGYSVPRVTPENALSITLLVRLTPGPPYSFQCYLLGLAAVPFRTYLVTSWICLLPWVIGAVVLGRGAFNGNLKMVLIGFGVLVAAGAVVQVVRRVLSKRAS
jgi:uncharacterized membrane protein YdjX (TVP38/TMEM64 family)